MSWYYFVDLTELLLQDSQVNSRCSASNTSLIMFFRSLFSIIDYLVECLKCRVNPMNFSGGFVVVRLQFPHLRMAYYEPMNMVSIFLKIRDIY
jgi:hypothetical protein